MKNLSRTALVLTLSFFFAGCIQVSSPQTSPQKVVQKTEEKVIDDIETVETIDAASEPGQTTEPIVPLSDDVKIDIQKSYPADSTDFDYSKFKKSLNKFETTISFPENWIPYIKIKKIITITGSVSQSAEGDDVSLNGGTQIENNWVINYEEDPWKGQPEIGLYDYRPRTLTIKVIFNEEVIAEHSLSLIPDLILENTQKLSSLGMTSGAFQFGAVYFEKDSILQIENLKVTLNTDRLYAGSNSRIETYSASTTLIIPEEGQIGLSGGALSINAERASGALKVSMRGSQGGKGKDATQQITSGTVGAKGLPAQHEWICKLGGGKEKQEYCSYKCKVQPENGRQGGQGAKGSQGGKGMPGGASGYVEINVQRKMHQFTVENDGSMPGKGGEPGASNSQGGPGGQGGEPGPTVEGCNSASQGPVGLIGLPGDPGESGSEGNFELSTINIEGQITNFGGSNEK